MRYVTPLVADAQRRKSKAERGDASQIALIRRDCIAAVPDDARIRISPVPKKTENGRSPAPRETPRLPDRNGRWRFLVRGWAGALDCPGPGVDSDRPPAPMERTKRTARTVPPQLPASGGSGGSAFSESDIPNSFRAMIIFIPASSMKPHRRPRIHLHTPGPLVRQLSVNEGRSAGEQKAKIMEQSASAYLAAA